VHLFRAVLCYRYLNVHVLLPFKRNNVEWKTTGVNVSISI